MSRYLPAYEVEPRGFRPIGTVDGGTVFYGGLAQLHRTGQGDDPRNVTATLIVWDRDECVHPFNPYSFGCFCYLRRPTNRHTTPAAPSHQSRSGVRPLDFRPVLGPRHADVTAG
ncbi:hypothetical protein [Streptosporangium roseum]|uniref:hypothetical protein n=1 Tax=Streptosporangium roseum TaxID=2001 RepID=UPI00331AA183